MLGPFRRPAPSRRDVLRYALPAVATAIAGPAALIDGLSVDVDDVLVPDFGQWDLPR